MTDPARWAHQNPTWPPTAFGVTGHPTGPPNPPPEAPGQPSALLWLQCFEATRQHDGDYCFACHCTRAVQVHQLITTGIPPQATHQAPNPPETPDTQ